MPGRAAEPARGPRAASKLALHLIERWAWGSLSAPELQNIAFLAVGDHEDPHPDLMRLSTIGSSGVHQNNCHRDLVSYRLAEPLIGRAISSIRIFTRKPPLRILEVDQCILLPHDLFGTMFEL